MGGPTGKTSTKTSPTTSGTTTTTQSEGPSGLESAGNQAVEQLLGRHRATLTCPPGSVLTEESSNFAIGNAVHDIVEDQYLGAARPALGTENFIFVDRPNRWGEVYTRTGGPFPPTTLEKLDRPLHGALSRGAVKSGDRASLSLGIRPDILDDKIDRVYEIKSVREMVQGHSDLLADLEVLSTVDEKVTPTGQKRGRNWQAGTWVPPDFEYPQGGIPYQVTFDMPEDGLILYSIWACRKEEEQKKKEDQPEQYQERSWWEDLWKLPLIGLRPGNPPKEPPDIKPPGPGEGEPDWVPEDRPWEQPADQPRLDQAMFYFFAIVAVATALYVLFPPAAILRIATIVVALFSGAKLSFAGGGGDGDGGEAEGAEGEGASGGTAAKGGTAGKTGAGQGGKGGTEGTEGTAEAGKPGATKTKGKPVDDKAVAAVLEALKQFVGPDGKILDPAEAERLLKMGIEFLKQFRKAKPGDPNAIAFKDLTEDMLPLLEDALEQLKKTGPGGQPGGTGQGEGQKPGGTGKGEGQKPGESQGDKPAPGETKTEETGGEPKERGEGVSGEGKKPAGETGSGEGKGTKSEETSGKGTGGGTGGGRGEGEGRKQGLRKPRRGEGKRVPLSAGESFTNILDTFEFTVISNFDPTSVSKGSERSLSIEFAHDGVQYKVPFTIVVESVVASGDTITIEAKNKAGWKISGTEFGVPANADLTLTSRRGKPSGKK